MKNTSPGQTPSSRGNLSKSKIFTAYIQAGYIAQAGCIASLPFDGGAPYDLVVDTGLQLLRVQLKIGHLRNECILFTALRIHGHHGTKRYKYEADEFDCFAVYCLDNNEIYMMPTLAEPAKTQLRVAATINGQ